MIFSPREHFLTSENFQIKQVSDDDLNPKNLPKGVFLSVDNESYNSDEIFGSKDIGLKQAKEYCQQRMEESRNKVISSFSENDLNSKQHSKDSPEYLEARKRQAIVHEAKELSPEYEASHVKVENIIPRIKNFYESDKDYSKIFDNEEMHKMIKENLADQRAEKKASIGYIVDKDDYGNMKVKEVDVREEIDYRPYRKKENAMNHMGKSYLEKSEISNNDMDKYIKNYEKEKKERPLFSGKTTDYEKRNEQHEQRIRMSEITSSESKKKGNEILEQYPHATNEDSTYSLSKILNSGLITKDGRASEEKPKVSKKKTSELRM